MSKNTLFLKRPNLKSIEFWQALGEWGPKKADRSNMPVRSTPMWVMVIECLWDTFWANPSKDLRFWRLWLQDGLVLITKLYQLFRIIPVFSWCDSEQFLTKLHNKTSLFYCPIGFAFVMQLTCYKCLAIFYHSPQSHPCSHASGTLGPWMNQARKCPRGILWPSPTWT